MSSAIITLTTDFGTLSPYVAAMKGVALSINPDVTLVDITHAISPQDVSQAAAALLDATPYFPPGTIHVAVVDPGVGTERKIVYAEIGPQRYIAPDNGTLFDLAERTPPGRLIEITNREYCRSEISTTFHGRDVMAPVAAHLTLGARPERLGPPLERLTALERPQVRITPGSITGSVRTVDSFGNLITDVAAEMIAASLDEATLTIRCNEHITEGIAATYADRPDGSLVALIGSGGYLELAVVNGSAAEQLGAGVGQQVEIRW